MTFDSYLNRIISTLRGKHGVYAMFIQGDNGLGCPPFMGECDFDGSTQAFIPDYNIGNVGYKGIIVYKDSFDDSPVGACLEQVSMNFMSSIEASGELYGMPIEYTDLDGNCLYIKFA